ncbi:MAG: hypothetical protein ACSLFD_10010 [Solirubrobacterales bacterium]
MQAPIRWGQLEVEAFAEHPDIREQLDPTRRYGRFRGGSIQRQLWVAIPTIIILGAAYLAPITGFSILYNGRYGLADLDPTFAVTAGGILFGVGLLAMLLNGVTWLLRSLRWSFLRAIHAGTTLGVGVLSIPVIYLRSPGVPNGRFWVTIVVVTTLVSLVVSIMAIRSFVARAPAPARTEGPNGPAARLARIDALVGELSPAERSAASADIAAALAELRHRGLISPEFIARAETAKLGHLAITLSTKRASPKRPA